MQVLRGIRDNLDLLHVFLIAVLLRLYLVDSGPEFSQGQWDTPRGPPSTKMVASAGVVLTTSPPYFGLRFR